MYTPTGIEGLDEILGGGLLTGNCFLIAGVPGAGKTTLGLNIIYNGIVKYNQPGVVITFEEFPEQIYADARGFGWDLQALEAEGKLKIICTSPEVFRQELMEADSFLMQDLIQVGAKRILVDSITLMENLSEDPQVLRGILNSIRSTFRRMGVTSFMTKEIEDLNNRRVPFEEYVVDGVINLTFEAVREQNRLRYIEITKSRGQACQTGKHSYKLTSQGCTVFPQFRPSKSVDWNSDYLTERVTTGIGGLDEMTCGGFFAGSTSLVAGSTGVGKTMLSLQFLISGARQGEPCLFVAFEERPQELIRFASSYGLPLEEYLKSGLLEIIYHPLTDLHLDEVLCTVKKIIKQKGIKRMVIDSLTHLSSCVVNPDRAKDYIFAFVDLVRQFGITSLMISETPNILGQFEITNQKTSFMVDTIIILRYVEIDSEIQRAISVLKMRGSSHEKSIRRYHISSQEGIIIDEKFQGKEGILTGVPRGAAHQLVNAFKFR